MRRDYCFRIIASARDGEFSKWIEMPVFTVGVGNLPAENLKAAFDSFLETVKEPENDKVSAAILQNLSIAINREHAMDLEMKRLEDKG